MERRKIDGVLGMIAIHGLAGGDSSNLMVAVRGGQLTAATASVVGQKIWSLSVHQLCYRHHASCIMHLQSAWTENSIGGVLVMM